MELKLKDIAVSRHAMNQLKKRYRLLYVSCIDHCKLVRSLIKAADSVEEVNDKHGRKYHFYNGDMIIIVCKQKHKERRMKYIVKTIIRNQ